MPGKLRNSNLELLRILSILSVVALHAFRHAGQGVLFDSEISWNYMLAVFTSSWGCGGVDIFLIISAYFLLRSDRVKPVKMLSVILATNLYALATYLFSVWWQGRAVSPLQIAYTQFSPVSNTYWFVTSYLFLYLIHPILNQILAVLSEKQTEAVALILVSLLFGYKFFYSAAPVESVGIGVAIYFCVAVYQRKCTASRQRKRLYCAGILAAVLILGSEILYAFPGTKSGWTRYMAVQMTGKYSPFLLVLAFAVFDWFRCRAPFYSQKVNRLSRYTLAVYILHESYYIYPILWDKIIPVPAWFGEPWFILAYIGAILGLFAGLSALDMLLSPLYTAVARMICRIGAGVFGTCNDAKRQKP